MDSGLGPTQIEPLEASQSEAGLAASRMGGADYNVHNHPRYTHTSNGQDVEWGYSEGRFEMERRKLIPLKATLPATVF